MTAKNVKTNKNSENSDIKKFNLRSSGDSKLIIDPSTVPTLVPADVLSPFMEGDTKPYYKIQSIDYPVKANGYTYTEEFFRSFLAKLNRSYIPGSKNGHSTSWGERPPTDLMLVGGQLNSVGNGAGTVLFKMYIPKSGETGNNEFFIKENQAGNVDYSLVSYTRDEVKQLPDGSSVYNVLESLYGERQDAVEYGKGAMKQKTNTLSNDDDIIENRRIKRMEKQEVLDALKIHKENAQVSLPEIARHLGLETMLVTDEHKNAVSEMSEIKKLCGNVGPLEFIKNSIAKEKQNAEKVRDADMAKICGPVTFAENGKKNELRELGEMFFAGKELSEENITAFKANSTFVRLAAERADWSSEANSIGVSDQGKKNTTAIGGAIKI